MISDCFAESRITQLTLAVFVTLNRDTKLITNLIDEVGQTNDATDLVSCDWSHETCYLVFEDCGEVREIYYSIQYHMISCFQVPTH